MLSTITAQVNTEDVLHIEKVYLAPQNLSIGIRRDLEVTQAFT